MKPLWEKHGGREKSIIETDGINQKKPERERYIVPPKKYSKEGRKIPEATRGEEMNKNIDPYEGKKASTKAQGRAEIKKYQDLEQDIRSEHDPNSSVERRPTREGGQKENDPTVPPQLEEIPSAHKKKEFI
jgi:hypothetical protein